MDYYPIACFISPHGFGHAARASAVMATVREMEERVCWEIFTTVPQWFFEDSVGHGFHYHETLTDIGLVQDGPFQADLEGTLKRLDGFLPFSPGQINGVVQAIKGLQCRLVLCDISPMGIVAAREAGIPSILMENFTWDWIYEQYHEAHRPLERHTKYLRHIFEQADYHIQTKPVCLTQPAHLKTSPISRKVRVPGFQVRKALGVPEGMRLVTLTTGGIPMEYGCMDPLLRQKAIYFAIPGGGSAFKKTENVILLPHHSDFLHPDIVHASDAVVGKLGYSTLAEVYHAGIPFAYITRLNFRESDILSSFVQDKMKGIALRQETFNTGEWVSVLPDLLALPRVRRPEPNGADGAATFILDLLNLSNYSGR